MPRTNNKVTKEKNNSRVYAFWLSILAGILLVIANSAIWVNRYVFDNDNFTSVVTQSITSESSRQAIAQGVTDRVFEDRPALKNVAGNVSTNIVSGLLGTSQANNAISTVVSKLQALVTTDNPQDIAIELGGVKSGLTQLYDVATNLGRQPKVDPNNIPDQIVLVEADQIPNFYKISVVFLWLAPLAFIGAVVALVYPYVRNKREYKAIMMIQGACVAAAGLLALLVGPLFRPPLLANVERASGRTVIGNLYDAFIATFNQQALVVIGLGLLVLVIGTVLFGYQLYKNKR